MVRKKNDVFQGYREFYARCFSAGMGIVGRTKRKFLPVECGFRDLFCRLNRILTVKAAASGLSIRETAFMKIANTGPVGSSPAQRSRRTSGSGSAFAGQVQNDAPVRSVAPPAGLSGVNGLLTVQEIADPLEEKRRAIQHGEDLLDHLDELRHGLLTGRFPKAGLSRILTMVQDRSPQVTDPALREILQEIELRAAVELAKLGQIE